jgi:hypothetical protein
MLPVSFIGDKGILVGDEIYDEPGTGQSPSQAIG